MAAVLFVTAGASPTASEQALMNRVTALGHTVTNVDDGAAVDGDGTGKAAIVVLQSISSASLGTVFRNFTGGLVVCEDGLWDTEQDFGASVGTNTPVTQLNILTTSHAIISGAGIGSTGLTTMVTTGAAFTFITTANISSGAVHLAATANSASNICLAAWETGATLQDASAAPGRRVLFPLKNSAGGENYDFANATFFALFDSAVTWAIGAVPGKSPPFATRRARPALMRR